MKVIVFPFDNYVRPLIEYEKLWHFEICGLISPMGFGINNMQMYENDKKYIMDSFWLQEHKNRCLYNIYL